MVGMQEPWKFLNENPRKNFWNLWKMSAEMWKNLRQEFKEKYFEKIREDTLRKLLEGIPKGIAKS